MKRTLAALLSALLLLGLFPAALAADTPEDKAMVLSALDIMSGDENGDLNLAAPVTRAQFIKMAVAAHPTGRYAAQSAATSPFYDVPSTHWAAGYVSAAVDLGLARGYLDGLFRPDNTITLEEAVSILLKLLGYEDTDLVGAYPGPQLAAYHSLDLDEGVTAQQGQAITRQDAQNLFYNLLRTENKSGQVYLTTLGYAVTEDGEPDLLDLINSAMEGPLVAGDNWENTLGFSVKTAYLNGNSAHPSDVKAGDVIYYSDSLHTVWAYRERVTGIYESASPSLSAPTSVTVSGQTYTLDGEAVKLALSDVGGGALGTQVTLLLGRDGKAAAVADASTPSGNYEKTVIRGIFRSKGTASYPDENGHSYDKPTVTLTATNGLNYTYPLADPDDVKNFVEGKPIQVTLKNGEATVEALPETVLTGRFTSDGTKLGNRPLAADVEIIDLSDNNDVIVVEPQRLAGAVVDGNDVRYASRNSDGEVDCIILDDYTGDAYQYGFLVDGVQQPVQFIRTEMVEVETEAGIITVPEDIYYRLRETRLTDLSYFSAKNGTVTYQLSDQVIVYEKRDGKYYEASLGHILEGEYSLTGYYDKGPGDGGRIRVIIAEAK